MNSLAPEGQKARGHVVSKAARAPVCPGCLRPSGSRRATCRPPVKARAAARCWASGAAESAPS